MPELTRRRILGGAAAASAGGAAAALLPVSVQKALASTPNRPGRLSDIKHVVLLMQENRSFDHYFGTLSGVAGFDDPNAITLSAGRPVFYQPDSPRTQVMRSAPLSGLLSMADVVMVVTSLSYSCSRMQAGAVSGLPRSRGRAGRRGLGRAGRAGSGGASCACPKIPPISDGSLCHDGALRRTLSTPRPAQGARVTG